MKKKILITTLLLATFLIPIQAKELNTPIFINGELKGKGFIEKSVTYIPLRSVSETLGAIVHWDSPTKTATLSKGYTTIVQRIGSDTARVNNKIVPIGAVAQIKDGLTYVPLRFVSENLGTQVHWDSTTRSVQITTDGAITSTPPTPPTNKPISKEETLKDKYINLSAKTRDITEFKAVPVTDYTTWDKVPQSVEGYRIDKIRFVEKKDLPIRVREDDIYDISIEKLDNGTEVLAVTSKVINREVTLLMTYATKEKGLMAKRDTHIKGVREDIIKIADRDFVVKQKYHLPNKLRDGVTIDQVEHIVFYTSSTKDSIAIKNPFR